MLFLVILSVLFVNDFLASMGWNIIDKNIIFNEHKTNKRKFFLVPDSKKNLIFYYFSNNVDNFVKLKFQSSIAILSIKDSPIFICIYVLKEITKEIKVVDIRKIITAVVEKDFDIMSPNNNNHLVHIFSYHQPENKTSVQKMFSHWLKKRRFRDKYLYYSSVVSNDCINVLDEN